MRANRKAGECLDCPTPAAVGKLRCDFHLAEHRRQAAKYRLEKAALRESTCRRYRQKHAAELAECGREYRQRHKPLIAFHSRRRRALKLGAAGACSVVQLQARIDLYGGLCWVPGCGKAYEAIDHVIPLSKGGSNWPSNLRPICKSHNSRKRAKMPDIFLATAAI